MHPRHSSTGWEQPYGPFSIPRSSSCKEVCSVVSPAVCAQRLPMVMDMLTPDLLPVVLLLGFGLCFERPSTAECALQRGKGAPAYRTSRSARHTHQDTATTGMVPPKKNRDGASKDLTVKASGVGELCARGACSMRTIIQVMRLLNTDSTRGQAQSSCAVGQSPQ